MTPDRWSAVLERLPATFSTYIFEQSKDWPLLFPAEQNYFDRLMAVLDRSEPQAIESLFAPVRTAEEKMGVSEKTWPRRQFTLEQVDFLNRSPHYPDWRAAVAQVFARLDPLLDAEVARTGRPRLIIVISPPELPVGPDRMWTRLRERGRSVPIAPAEGMLPSSTGIAKSFAATRARSPYDTWVIAAAPLPAKPQNSTAVSYASLDAYRTRLMSEVNQLVRAEEIRGPRQLGARLNDLKMRPSESEAGGDPRIAEYLRSVLLAGNGTLLINNTFVEWASVQAIRRARPSLAVISFGIRSKVKPFSSLLIYSDQDKSNPIPTQMDTLGSYVDLEVFYQYIWQECEKYAEYRRNTAYLFLAEGQDEFFLIAPADFPLPVTTPLPPEKLFEAATAWLQI